MLQEKGCMIMEILVLLLSECTSDIYRVYTTGRTKLNDLGLETMPSEKL